MLFNALEIITEPTVEPITHEDVKPYLKIDSTVTADDTVLDTICIAARRAAETYLKRALISQKWRLTLDDQPDVIDLPLGQLISLNAVNVTAEGGTDTAQSATIYEYKTGENPKLWLKTGQIWGTTTRMYALMEVEYTVGYGVAAVNVPQPIIEGLKRMVAYLYERRGDVGDTVQQAMYGGRAVGPSVGDLVRDSGAELVLAPYRIVRI